MAQADSNSTTGRTFVRSPSIVPDTALDTFRTQEADPIFAAIEAHKHALGRRNGIIEEICATEERLKAEERETWESYEKASIELLTTRPSTMAGAIALMSYVALPEFAGPGVSDTVLDGARLSSNREAAAAAEHFPALSAEALREITGEC